MLLFGMILLMSSFGIKAFVKKPAVFIVGVIIILILIFSLLFGGGGGQDPTAKSVKNLSNRHQALISVIDSYSGDVRSANLKSNLSQVSIILTADKNDIDVYFSGLSKESKKVKSSFSARPRKEIVTKLDQAKISNNLDSELKSTVKDELQAIEDATQKVKKANATKAKLNALADKLVLNTQTMFTTVDQSR